MKYFVQLFFIIFYLEKIYSWNSNFHFVFEGNTKEMVKINPNDLIENNKFKFNKEESAWILPTANFPEKTWRPPRCCR